MRFCRVVSRPRHLRGVRYRKERMQTRLTLTALAAVLALSGCQATASAPAPATAASQSTKPVVQVVVKAQSEAAATAAARDAGCALIAVRPEAGGLFVGALQADRASPQDCMRRMSGDSRIHYIEENARASGK